MKPTAPPVKRGRPGTKGDRNSAISRRSAGTNGSSVSVVTPDRSIVVLPSPRAQDEERVLAEERIARDLLAAFDALEQERVVGVLGDLEEGGDRGQQVGNDLLDDRHEGAPPRQLHELVERRLFHEVSIVLSSWRCAAGPRRHRGRRKFRRAGAARSTARTAAPPGRRASRGRRWCQQPAARASASSAVSSGS